MTKIGKCNIKYGLPMLTLLFEITMMCVWSHGMSHASSSSSGWVEKHNLRSIITLCLISLDKSVLTVFKKNANATRPVSAFWVLKRLQIHTHGCFVAFFVSCFLRRDLSGHSFRMEFRTPGNPHISSSAFLSLVPQGADVDRPCVFCVL